MPTKDYLKFLLEGKHLIVNKNDHYNTAMLGQISEIEENAVKFLWHSIAPDAMAKGTVRYTIEEFEQQVDPFLIVDRRRSFDSGPYLDLQKKIRKNWHIFINTLHFSDQYRLKTAECINVLVKELGVSVSDAEGIIKSHIALNSLRYVKLKRDEFIALSPDRIELENKKRYLSSISNEIKSQSDRINYVISHGQTVGNYREQLFISVLRKYVPKKFHVATGFIEGSSKQIDIIIYDQHNYIPVFREDDLVVVKKEAVIAVIEIKTTLDSGTLADSLEGIDKIFDSGMSSVPFFKGIFAFNTDLTNKSAAVTIGNFYKKNEIAAIHHHLDVVCVPNAVCAYIDYSGIDAEQCSSPVLYTVEDTKGFSVGESFFLQRLFAFLEVENSAKKINGLYFSELRETAESSPYGRLTEENWLPYKTFFTEDRSTAHLDLDDSEIMEIQIKNVKERIRDVRKWMEGAVDREYLIEKYNNIAY